MRKASSLIDNVEVGMCVLDLGNTWSHWSGIAGIVPDTAIRLHVIGEEVPPSGELLFVTMPPTGLTAFQRQLVQLGIGSSKEAIFAACIESDQLEEGDRERAGYVVLTEEVAQDFAASLIAIPKTGEHEKQLVLRTVRAAFQKARALASIASVRRDRELIVTHGNANNIIDDGINKDPITTFSDALTALLEHDQAEALLELQILASETEKQALEWQQQSEAELRTRLPMDGRVACDRSRSTAPLMYGDFTHHLTRELSEVTEKIQRLLDTPGWTKCKVAEFTGWRQMAATEFRSPEITIPVVGRFSSGKTTLLNNFLGLTPGGHRLLRTALTHNTALLARFFYCEGPEQRVECTYRSRIEYESLCELGALEDRAVGSPCDGIIRIIRTDRDGTTMIVLEEYSSSRPLSVHLSPWHPPRKGIIEGTTVSKGQPLSKGSSTPELEQQAIENGDAVIMVNGKVVNDVLILIRAGKLVNVTFHLSSLSSKRGKAIVIHQVMTDQDADWMLWLSSVLKEIKTPVWLSDIEGPYRPLQISFSADVNTTLCIASHPLRSDSDWDWFQGPPSKTTTPEVLREAARGFAESADAELIVDEARIFLNSPLFELTNMVDTPGLNSICRRHSIKTEEFVERGTAFLVVLQLHTAGNDRTVGDLFRLIRNRLDSLTANSEKESSSAADHVFVLLNRFEMSSKDHNWREQLDRFTALIEKPFGLLPPIYVADLKAQSSPGSVADALWGQPSLADLFRDLRRYVATRGVDQKLKKIAVPLDEAWQNARQRVHNLASDIGKRSQAEKLKALEKARVDLKDAATQSAQYAESRIRAVNQAANDVKALSEAMLDKDGFARAGKHHNRLSEFNNARDKLREIVSYQQRALSMAVRSVVSPPTIKAAEAKDCIDLLPVLTPYSFSREIDSIVESWPGFWKGFWNSCKRIVEDGDFDRHATIQRRRIESNYFDDLGSKLQINLIRLKKQLEINLQSAVQQADKDIDERERTLFSAEATLMTEKQKLAVQENGLAAFQNDYSTMKDILQGYRLKMRQISKEE